MTRRTTAVDHPSRRLVVALPQTYDGARGGAMPPQLGSEMAFLDADRETV